MGDKSKEKKPKTILWRLDKHKRMKDKNHGIEKGSKNKEMKQKCVGVVNVKARAKTKRNKITKFHNKMSPPRVQMTIFRQPEQIIKSQTETNIN